MKQNIKIAMVILVFAILIFAVTLFKHKSPSPNNVDNNSVNQSYVNSSMTQGNDYGSDYSNAEDIVQINDSTQSNGSLITNQGPMIASFRIDDITFYSGDKKVLENALYLAKKYNIIFDLSVIAQPFSEGYDPSVYAIYQNNKQYFEIVAHGYTHWNAINSSLSGEFYSPTAVVPYATQEQRISGMKKIFQDKNMILATQVFITPGSEGDNNTIAIAEKYGYRLMTFKRELPNKQNEYQIGGLTVLKAMVSIDMTEQQSDDSIMAYQKSLVRNAGYGVEKLHIVMHEVNFYKAEDSDKLIGTLMNVSPDKVAFKPISATLN